MKMSNDLLRALGATQGAFSMVTSREDEDSQLTIDADEKEVLFSVRDERTIPRGKTADKGPQAWQSALLFRGAKRIGPTKIKVNFPKLRKSELRLYFRVDGFNPSGYDVWYIFTNDRNELCVGYCDPDTFLALARSLPPSQKRSGSREGRVPKPLTRVRREINARRGQPGFRRSLLQRFGATCCVTGSRTSQVLEAAHIATSAGTDDHRVSNGLLLRSDVHTLFDLGLIAIHPQDRLVYTSNALSESEYVKHHRTALRAKQSLVKQLDVDALTKRWTRFEAINSLFEKSA